MSVFALSEQNDKFDRKMSFDVEGEIKENFEFIYYFFFTFF